jgi:hypothetical protein
MGKLLTWIERNNKIIFGGLVMLQCALCLFFYLKSGVRIEPDTSSYIEPAKEFLQTGRMTMNGKPILVRTPGYIFILSVIYRISNYSNECVVFIQCLMVLLNSFMLYSIGHRLTDRKAVGILGVLFYVLDFTVYSHATMIMTDVAFSFFLLLSIFLLVSYLKKKYLRYLVLSVVVLQCAMLIRPQIVYFNLILCGVLVAAWLIRKINWKVLLIYLCTFLTIYCGWSARNEYYYGEFIFSSVNYQNFYLYYAPEVYACTEGALWGDKEDEKVAEGRVYLESIFADEYADASDMTELERLHATHGIAVKYLEKHIGALLKLCVFRLFWQMLGPDIVMFWEIGITGIFSYLIACLNGGALLVSYSIYAVGFLKHLKKLKWFDWALFLLSCYLIASTVVIGYWRFRIAFYLPCLVGMMGVLRLNTGGCCRHAHFIHNR